MSTALQELLIRHVDAGTIPGGVALLGAGDVEVVTAGLASIGGGLMADDAIMRIQSMTESGGLAAGVGWPSGAAPSDG